mmetsp:Transcript_2398/g.3429  ORF Transcript_2398/g.3429 Transcript_2398/m.3429 type:complete len:671 (-) Transcript_2398:139-2151(-)
MRKNSPKGGKRKSFNPKAKTFNPNAKTFNPTRLKSNAKAFNPGARSFNPAPIARAKSTPVLRLEDQPSGSHSKPPVVYQPSTPSYIPNGKVINPTNYPTTPVPEFKAVKMPPVDNKSRWGMQGIPVGYTSNLPMGNVQGMQGMQPVQGMQGMQPVQGMQGMQPVQGMQRMQPVQGMPNIQPVQGMQGMQGMPSVHSQQYTADPMGTQEMGDYDWEAERREQKRILLPLRRPVQSFFMPNSLVEDFQQQNQLLTARLQPEDRDFYRLPMTVDHERYHSLMPLPPAFDATQTSHAAHLYKVTSTKDGLHYVLRRETANLSEKYAARAIAPWIRLNKKISSGSHPTLVAVRTVFESQDFDEGKCLCFIYDYHPGAFPVFTQFQMLDSKKGLAGAMEPEHVLWSFFNQLMMAITTVHPQGLAVNNITPYRVLVKSNRLRINFCGIPEALQLVPGTKSVSELQFSDLKDTCRLLMSIALRTVINDVVTEQKAFEIMKASYSEDLSELLKYVLFTKHDSKKLPTVWDVQSLAWHRLVDEVHHTYTHIDYLQNQLAKEHQNGRLFALIAKLSFINERPEHRNNPKWSETGDRYLIKLFRDFVFHTVDEEGRPQIDLGHVVKCLNKLDAASAEKTLLTSRNEDSMLVVSYKELNRCVHAAFEELKVAADRKGGDMKMM